MNTNVKNDSGFLVLGLRLVVGWTYFSAFYRRTVLANKLDPDIAGYIGVKFNHFLPNALGIKPLIQYLLENPDALWWSMFVFTIIEAIVGLFIMIGLFTRFMSIGLFGLAFGILLGSGWLGTTCLDEWQIGSLGVATGFLLFFAGGGMYSVDNYLLRKKSSMTTKNWFAWLGSGTLPIENSIFTKIVLTGSVLIFGLTLATNQIFHGGVWGKLHNKSVKPKLEITQAVVENDRLSFDVYRVEGVDVYGAWMIAMELKDSQNNVIFSLSQKDLSQFDSKNIDNYYIAKVKPGKHSLIIPLGAKAKISLENPNLKNLPQGEYTLKITDISGAFWEHIIVR